jgi:hypothetical protein
MLDDHRREAVAEIGDFGFRASLPSALLPSYPVTLTKRDVEIFCTELGLSRNELSGLAENRVI